MGLSESSVADIIWTVWYVWCETQTSTQGYKRSSAEVGWTDEYWRMEI